MIIACPECSSPFQVVDGQIAALVQVECPTCSFRMILDFEAANDASLIEDGMAVQLATYAFGRSMARGKFPAVAYLVLSDGLFYTPSASPVQGDGNRSLIDGPAIETVWRQFYDAIDKAEDWLTGDVPVPARPLQDPSEWPDGVDRLVLDAKLKADAMQEVCKYCDYKSICGLQETS